MDDALNDVAAAARAKAQRALDQAEAAARVTERADDHARGLAAIERSRLGLQIATRLALIPTVVLPVTILLWKAVFVG